MKLMKKSKAVALFLAAAVSLSGLYAAPTTAKAETTTDATTGTTTDSSSKYINLVQQEDTALANVAKTYTFSVTNSTDIYLDIFVPTAVGLTLNVPTANTQRVISSVDWSYDEIYGLYYYPLIWSNPSSGDHTISLTFDADTPFLLFVDQVKPVVAISNETIVLTKGFSQTLSVVNGTAASWSTDNAKVAVVDSTGKVTAKNTGSATVTATTEDGQTVSCDVNVKANVYTKSKMTFGDTRYGNAYISISKVSYNKKGDLVIKATYLNNCGHKITHLQKVNITVKNKSGKVIGKYTLKSKKATILQGGQKTFTYTIKKAKLKQKKTQDLRNASVKSSWRYRYVY